jgi:hypothetical protein
MQPPASDELLESQAHGPPLRMAPWAFRPFLSPQDNPLAIPGEQPPLGKRSAAQVTRQIDQYPLPGRITLTDMDIPLRAAQLVQELLDLLRALAHRQREGALRYPPADGRPQLAPKHRHDHPHREQKPMAHRDPPARVGQASTGHQTVHVWVQQQCLRPGV